MDDSRDRLARWWPLLDLEIRTPRLVLRLPDDRDLADLVEFVGRGIHPADEMPFLHPFTAPPSPERERGVLSFQWQTRGSVTPEHWNLSFVVLADGVVVGSQDLNATDFAVTREVHTGSWVGQEHQGRGIGREMRTGVLHLAFAGLGALVARSGHLDGNEASRRVSEALGYVPDGTATVEVQGRRRIEHRMVLAADRWDPAHAVEVELAGVDEARRQLGC